MQIYLFTVFFLSKKMEEKSNKYEKSEHLGLIVTKRCENLRKFQFPVRYQKRGHRIFFFEIESDPPKVGSYNFFR